MPRKIGKRRKFQQEFKKFASKEELGKIYDKSYRLTGIMKQLNPKSFLKADGDTRNRSELAFNIAKEFAWGIANDMPSRLSVYYQKSKLSMSERLLLAEKAAYRARLNFARNSSQSFLELYGDKEIPTENMTINEALEKYENDEIDKLKLNELIKTFKELSTDFEGKTKEWYATQEYLD